MAATDNNAAPFSWKRELTFGVARALLLLGLVRLVQKYVWNPVEANYPQSSQTASECAWKPNQEGTLYVYLSKEPIQVQFEDAPGTILLTQQDNVKFMPSSGSCPSFSIKKNIQLPILKRNEEYYAHIYLMRGPNNHPDLRRSKSRYDPEEMIYRRITLTSNGKLPKQGHNLLHQKESQKPPSILSDEEEVVFINPKIYMALVQATGPLGNPSSLHPGIRRLAIYAGKKYLPFFYTYEDWSLRHFKVPYAGGSEVEISTSFNDISWLKLQALVYFGESFRIQQANFGSVSSEFEQLKEMFMETNIWLLIITLAVSLLHSLFDFLAFKNDIQFWRTKEDFQGMSVRAVLINAFFQLIIFLYLLDHETSWVVIASVGVGVLIELWKIKKIFKVSFNENGRIKLEIKNTGTKTAEHDETATLWLSILCIPLIIGYSIYSLMYEEYKSWYSFVLSTAVGFVYAFGFISMMPQLFINYKLKSVAHMPWRVFTYKALNTFIDDLFAFVIRMPTLHRIACFRDDLLFVVYLYQRWIYPTDLSRTNEFGQSFSGKEEDEKVEKEDASGEPAIEEKLPSSPEEKVNTGRKSLRKRN
jgi:hypothetical protein